MDDALPKGETWNRYYTPHKPSPFEPPSSAKHPTAPRSAPKGDDAACHVFIRPLIPKNVLDEPIMQLVFDGDLPAWAYELGGLKKRLTLSRDGVLSPKLEKG